jgi:hypothetical protein
MTDENFKSFLISTLFSEFVMILIAKYLQGNYEMAERSQKYQNEYKSRIKSKRNKLSQIERRVIF